MQADDDGRHSRRRHAQPRQRRAQRPESDGRQAFQAPQLDLPKVHFDPTRVKLPQVAIIGFLIGILFHACVVFAILDDGSGGSSNASVSARSPTWA